MKIAVIGATGLVGAKILELLAARNFEYSELFLIASEKNKGNTITFQGKVYTLQTPKEALESFENQEVSAIALFSAGAAVATEFAPQFAKKGFKVIDNSSAFRADTDKKLIVPEVNASALAESDKIISNPNCSTIQLVMVLNPLHKKYKIRRVVVSTYQAVTGSGHKGINQLMNERKGRNVIEKAYSHPIDLNIIPHIDAFETNDYTKEEMKLINETKKILSDPSIRITATAVRIPVLGGHSESVNIEFAQPFDLQEVRKTLSEAPGLTLKDNLDNCEYPMPKDAAGKDEVFVGRVRRDESQANCLNLWIVADNLRKGAATNAVQIAEYLQKNELPKPCKTPNQRL